jgi:mono/diheme cytochrome c family protein
MPPWKDVLSKEEVELIAKYLQPTRPSRPNGAWSR